MTAGQPIEKINQNVPLYCIAPVNCTQTDRLRNLYHLGYFKKMKGKLNRMSKSLL